MDLALMNMQEIIHLLPESILVVDKEFKEKLPAEIRAYALEEIAEQRLPDQIENVIYHCGTRFETLEALFKKLSILNKIIFLTNI